MRRLVLVVDDYPANLTLVKAGLKDAHEVITAANGAQALQTLEKLRPDLIILDVMLPDMSGFEICSEVMSRPDPPPVIFLSASKTPSAKATGYNLGGAIYMEKPFDVVELRAVVASVLRRSGNGASLVRGDVHLDLTGQTLVRGEDEVPLTVSECKILRRLMASDGEVLPRDALLDSLGASDKCDRAVDNHISGLRRKMRSNTHEIVSVYGEGYRFKRKGELSGGNDN